MSTSTKKIASTAMAEFQRYRYIRENQVPLSTRIPDYWAATPSAFTSVAIAWSAVFVSWCVKQGGAGATDFAYSARHSVYVHAAINDSPSSAGFTGHAPATYVPKVGDILQNNRSGNTFAFEYARRKTSYESHAAVVIEVGSDNAGKYLRTIGGNEGDSVGLKEVRLSAGGTVRNGSGLYIAVLECKL